MHFFDARSNATHCLQVAAAYSVELSSVSQQLPTLLLFEGGEEKGRLPKKWGSTLTGAAFTKKDVVRCFELDARLARCKDR